MKIYTLRPDTVTHTELQFYSFRYHRRGPEPWTNIDMTSPMRKVGKRIGKSIDYREEYRDEYREE